MSDLLKLLGVRVAPGIIVLCEDDDDVAFVQPYLNATVCKDEHDAVREALAGRNVVISVAEGAVSLTVPANVLLVCSWALLNLIQQDDDEEYVH